MHPVAVLDPGYTQNAGSGERFFVAKKVEAKPTITKVTIVFSNKTTPRKF
jgi:hypothetical protein